MRMNIISSPLSASTHHHLPVLHGCANTEKL
jgi:hypothetical protein